MSTYVCCPACSSPKRKPTKRPQVFECAKCEALYGDCWLGDSYELVKPFMSALTVTIDRVRYFDFTTVGSNGVSRRHGWFDKQTGYITQIG